MSRKILFFTMIVTTYVMGLTVLIVQQADGIGSGFLLAAFRQG